MRTTGTNRAVPGRRIDSHLITSLVLTAGTARKKEEAASRFLSFILIYAPQKRIGYAQRSNDHHRPASLVLPAGASRQKRGSGEPLPLLFCFYVPQQRTGIAQWSIDHNRPISPVLPVGAYRLTCRRVPCPERGGQPRTGSSAAARDPQCRWSRQRSCR